MGGDGLMELTAAPPLEPTLSDSNACFRLAEAHRELASQMSPESENRALMLRCAEQWISIGRARSDDPLEAPRRMEVVG